MSFLHTLFFFIKTCSLTLVLSLQSPNSLGATSDTISSWCSETPNPSECEHHLNLLQKNSSLESINSGSDFLKVFLKSALHASIEARTHTLSLGTKCQNPKQKAAWLDCLELLELATQQLSQTMTTDPLQSHEDSQTWLSAVLTHLETCKSGFKDLGVSGDQLLPLMGFPNTSHLVSNALAMNNDQTLITKTRAPNGFESTSGFPKWVKGGDRKLLASTSGAADIVVAADGSRDYKTVGEAVGAAKKNNGSGRTVIYIKPGVYNEYISIATNNVMLTGDGIGKTIITGSRSVGGGHTTYGSPTVGPFGPIPP